MSTMLKLFAIACGVVLAALVASNEVNAESKTITIRQCSGPDNRVCIMRQGEVIPGTYTETVVGSIDQE